VYKGNGEKDAEGEEKEANIISVGCMVKGERGE